MSESPEDGARTHKHMNGRKKGQTNVEEEGKDKVSRESRRKYNGPHRDQSTTCALLSILNLADTDGFENRARRERFQQQY